MIKRIDQNAAITKHKPNLKNAVVSLDCLQHAADWLGQYSRILERLNANAAAR